MSPVQEDLGLASDLEAIDHALDVEGRFLIDAGCGDMHLSRALAQRGASVLAIDPDPVQAEKNRHAPITANVGFAEAGADAIPVDSHSVDGVLFPYSLHHVPAGLYESVFQEVLRVLKPSGFLYVLEPVAAGDLNDIMRLFHDEAAVRSAAQAAIDSLAVPRFQATHIIHYRTPVHYATWDDFADQYAGKSYNTNYSEADVRAESVRQRFHELGARRQFNFEAPKKVTILTDPIAIKAV
jgi:ubiquinone/menaquinone biosynthesis C-methylase UbiE